VARFGASGLGAAGLAELANDEDLEIAAAFRFSLACLILFRGSLNGDCLEMCFWPSKRTTWEDTGHTDLKIRTSFSASAGINCRQFSESGRFSPRILGAFLLRAEQLNSAVNSPMESELRHEFGELRSNSVGFVRRDAIHLRETLISAFYKR
jgi:hypothetical protein